MTLKTKTPKLMGKKLGMTHLFDDKGNLVVCTVIEVEPNVVVQVKTKESDGYNAIQLGAEVVKTKDPRTVEKRVSKPLRGHYKSAGVEPRKHLLESRLESVEGYSKGQEIDLTIFDDVEEFDVTGISIGKGYQGGMKKHNFAGLKASHGTGPVHRHLGSTGNRIGRCVPGGKRASQMGKETVTIQNLKKVKIHHDKQLIILKGAIPGPKNGKVILSKAVKRSAV